MFKHLCENKRRWGDKDLKGNRIGFNAWLNFYTKHTNSKKQKTYLDFIKVPIIFLLLNLEITVLMYML